MDDFPSIVADIVRNCLRFDPASRPTANDIVERLARWQFREYDLNRDENGNTDIHRLAAKDMVEPFRKLSQLLNQKKPVMINAVNHFGETPLMLFKDGYLKKLLLEYRRVPLSNREPSRVMECYHNIDIIGTLLKLVEKEDVDAIKLLGENDGFDTAIVKKICAQRKTRSFETPLHVAAKIGNVALFEALLGLGVLDAWRANIDGRTALHVASLHGHAEVMQKLIDLQNYSGEREDVEFFRVNVQDGRGKTPLHLAAESGNLSAVRVLLDHSATNVNLHDIQERTPIFDVVSATNMNASTQSEVFHAFVHHPKVNLNTKDSTGETILHKIARNDLVQPAQILLDRSDVKLFEPENEHWYTPLHLAVREQGFRVARTWLARDGVDVNVVDKYGNTLVHILAALRISVDGNHMTLMSFAKTLISRGDINFSLRNARGDTALHVAVQSNNTIVVEVLLSEANDKVTGNDLTALHLPPDSSVAKVMTSADVNARDRCNKTPLHLASYGNAAEVAKLLLSRGDVDVNARDEDQQTPLHIASLKNAAAVAKVLLTRNNIDVNARERKQRTPLHIASIENAAEVTTLLLLRSDVDVNARNNGHDTPLHMASWKNAAEVAAILLGRDDVDVNARTRSIQYTPLLLAVWRNAAEVAKLLLAREDVDVNAEDKSGTTALWVAERRFSDECAELFRARGATSTPMPEE